MFAECSICHFKLVVVALDGSEAVFNPWDYLPHTQLYMSVRELGVFLYFLRHVKQIDAQGTITVDDGSNPITLEVEHTRVAHR